MNMFIFIIIVLWFKVGFIWVGVWFNSVFVIGVGFVVVIGLFFIFVDIWRYIYYVWWWMLEMLFNNRIIFCLKI